MYFSKFLPKFECFPDNLGIDVALRRHVWMLRLWRADSSHQWRPQPVTHLLFPNRLRKRTERAKGKTHKEILMSWHKGTLVSEDKIKRKQAMPKSVTHQQQTNAQPVTKPWWLWKDCLQVLLLSMMSHGMGCPFGQLRSVVLAVSPLNLFPPQPALWDGTVRNGDSLDAVQGLFSNSYNTSVLSTLFWSPV